jgi:hypothetical protein
MRCCLMMALLATAGFAVVIEFSFCSFFIF